MADDETIEGAAHALQAIDDVVRRQMQLATLGRQETAASEPDALPGALIADAA